MGATWLPIDFNAAYIPGKATRVAHMNGESVERLMEIILQMKINLSHINETLHQQTYEIREQLGMVFEDEKRALERCLNSIDDKLKECSIHADEYQRLYASLATMREKLVQLGAEPSALPTAMPVTNVEAIIAWRLRELSPLGKF
jgi:hypothetical protein